VLHPLIILAVGVVAGMVNAIVGSGSLLTFPTLLALGYPAVLANVTNNVGLLGGSISGAVGYRRELVGQWRRVSLLLVPAISGGLLGAILLLALPSSVFEDVVPILILVAVGLVLVQPRLARRRAHRGESRTEAGPVLYAGGFASAVYGGYFGAAQGVIMLALLGITLDDGVQRLNAAKNVLVGASNAAAAVVFVVSTHIAWGAAAELLVGSTIGGQIGAHVGRRMHPTVLRVIIAVVGVGVAIKLIVTG
jgi:uncharacterized membrane protein YfcA